MLFHRGIVGKSPFVALLPLGNAYRYSLASLFSPPQRLRFKKQNQVMYIKACLQISLYYIARLLMKLLSRWYNNHRLLQE